MTAGHWLNGCRAGIDGHTLESRLNSIDFNGRALALHRTEVAGLTARIRNGFAVLDAAPKDQLADADGVLKELLMDFVHEISQLCEFIKSFVALHFLFRFARNQKLKERIEQAHGELDRFLEGILQSGLIASNQELVARLQELVNQQPWVVVVADDDLVMVNEKLQQPVSPEIVSETRCVLSSEVLRLGRLGILNPIVEAVNGHLRQPNPPEVDEQRRPMPRVIPPDEITFDGERDKSIGEGGCGTVWRAKLGLSTTVVVKRMIKKPLKTKCWNDPTTCTCRDHTKARDILTLLREAHVRELRIWCQLNHPHILRLHGTTSHGPRCSIVSEDAQHGQLDRFVKAAGRYAHLWRLLYEAALGIHYMHSIGIVHGDLKVDNILVGGDMKAKVADFGLSFRNGEHESVPQSAAPGVLAPEFFADNPVRSFPADVFAFGMCIVETYTGGPPWGSWIPAVVKLRFRKEELPYVFSTLNSEVRELVEKMCRFDPAERIGMNEVVVELKRLADNPPPPHPLEESR